MNNYFDGDQMKFSDKTMDMKDMNKMSGEGECCKSCQNECGCMCDPVYECPQERVCHRCINIDVPHVVPCNTKIINHYIYHHTFTPCYSCCEENVVSNVYGGRCC
jgi:hypothetical protein